ncbi:MAG: hypothetical protein LBU55_04790 [Elusimicrobiota bacterium]|jgi:tetratricopeptide (TPR) repeat protein|nr:hypothetical protein [Elusimicrobiota bacterium]
MKCFLTITAIFLFSLTCFAQNSYEEQIEKAQSFFKEGQFQKSIEIYEHLTQIEKINNPYIYYNLANTYYRNGDIGGAVLNIKKAVKLKPRDVDIRKNFEKILAASGQTHDVDFSNFLLLFFSLNELSMVFVSLLILIFIFSSILIFRKIKKLKILVCFFIGVEIIFTPFWILAVYNEVIVNSVVILSPCEARSGPEKSENSIFEVSAGKIAHVISRHSGWSYLKFNNKGQNADLVGWVKDSDIGQIK